MNDLQTSFFGLSAVYNARVGDVRSEVGVTTRRPLLRGTQVGWCLILSELQMHERIWQSSFVVRLGDTLYSVFAMVESHSFCNDPSTLEAREDVIKVDFPSPT